MLRFLKQNTGILTVIGFLFLMTIPASAVELKLPSDLFFYQPVASLSAQNAPWINPAAINPRQAGNMILFTQRQDRVIRDWGMSSTFKTIGIAYRQLDGGEQSDLKEYIFAFGGGRQKNIGFSYRYIKDGPGHLNKRHLWNAGLQMRKNRNLALGVRMENINRGKIDGIKTDINYAFGGTARVYRNMVFLSFEADMTDRENLSQADYITAIEVRPLPGLYLYGNFDNHSRFNLGLRMNFGSSYTGHYHNFSRDGKSLMGTTYLGSVKGRQASLTKPKKKSLVINLSGVLSENLKINPFKKKPLRFYDYVDGIYRAADDEGIDRIFLKIGTLRCGLAQAEELGEAVDYFKAKGKKVYAHLAHANNIGYLLACHADSLFIPPISQLSLIGLRAEFLSIKGLLDKIGVEVEIEKIDEYKTAAEPLINERPSKYYRAQIARMLDNLFDQLVQEVAENRGLTSENVKSLIDAAPMTSIMAVETGLVDGLLYADEAEKLLAEGGHSIFSRKISFHSYVHRPVYDENWIAPPKIAILAAEGPIGAGQSGGRMGKFEMLRAIRAIGSDPEIKGVLLRVNSPGGEVVASDLIWHELEKISRNKPLVISMGNMAASGGYYISSLPAEIFADRATITGSIGVFSGKANFKKLFDKIGIYSEIHTRGENAAIYSKSRPFTEQQRIKLRSQLVAFYDHFTALVGQARNISSDSVNAIGRGQVWTGTEALANGLVDHTGGLYPALDRLCQLSNVNRSEAQIEVYPRQFRFFDNPFGLSAITSRLSSLFSQSSEKLSGLELFESGNIFYRIPYDLTIE